MSHNYGYLNERIAIIISNYNMPEAANNLYDILDRTRIPHDIITIDNNSKNHQIPTHTTIALKQNIRQCNAWLYALNYADVLERLNKFNYFAYVFCTTAAIIQTTHDIIEPLIEMMYSIPDAAITHPALIGSPWPLMAKRNTGWREVGFVEFVVGAYRADWFNKVGRFNGKFRYNHGIDLDISYKARRDKMKQLLCDDIVITKDHDAGYKTGRYLMSVHERNEICAQEMNDVFTSEYGNNWRRLILDFS